MRAAASALLLLLFASAPGAALAQEINVLELDDFIDPALLKQDPPGPRRAFVAARLLAGGSENYHYRDRFTEGTVRFGRVATSLYVGDWQANLKVSGFGHPAAHRAPGFQVKSQLGHYFPLGDGRTARALVGWTYEDRGYVEGQDSVPGTHELSLELDFALSLRGLPHRLTGGAVYARNLTTGTHHLGAAYRVPVVRRPSGSMLQVGGGFFQSREVARELWQKWPTVMKFEISTDMFLLETGDVRVHAAYAPGWRTDNGAWNHELSVFVSVPLFNSIF